MLKLLALVAFCCLAGGCASTATITNLTPSQLPRNTTGLYLVEAAFDTYQHTVIPESIRPQVVIGPEFFPMQPAPVLKNRWETLVPVPAGQNFVYYQFRFDYDYKAIPKPRSDSVLSDPYKLEIVGP